jgi:hypothetical protein
MAAVPSITSFLRFPNPVNETSARVVATGATAMAAAHAATGWAWLLFPLVWGFLARVLSGPRLSPLGLFATRVATPWLERRGVQSQDVPGPPKRFAQGVGLAFSLAATMSWMAGADGASRWLTAALAAAAFLEAAFAVCLGCIVFGWLMRAGVVPQSVCAECADLSLRRANAGASAPGR